MPRTKGALTRNKKELHNKQVQRHKINNVYNPCSLKSNEKEVIKRIKNEKKYPDELKPHNWILSLTARQRKKIIKYMCKNKKLVCTRIELEKLIKRQ